MGGGDQVRGQSRQALEAAPQYNPLRLWDRTYTRKLGQVARGQIFRADGQDVGVVVEHLADATVVRLADGVEGCLPPDMPVEVPTIPPPLEATA